MALWVWDPCRRLVHDTQLQQVPCHCQLHQGWDPDGCAAVRCFFPLSQGRISPQTHDLGTIPMTRCAVTVQALAQAPPRWCYVGDGLHEHLEAQSILHLGEVRGEQREESRKQRVERREQSAEQKGKSGEKSDRDGEQRGEQSEKHRERLHVDDEYCLSSNFFGFRRGGHCAAMPWNLIERRRPRGSPRRSAHWLKGCGM